jgi:diadenylate cyclase
MKLSDILSRWRDILDVILIGIFLVFLFRMVRGTRVLQMFMGLGLILALALAAQWAGLMTGSLIVNGFLAPTAVILVVLFQPEIRRALAQLGKAALFHRSLSAIEETRTLEEIIRAVIPLSEKQIGAILVLERENELWDIVEMGIPMDAKVSRELLTSVFMPQSPLHDGAVVIRGDRIIAAGCFLPLSLNPDIGKMLGTRHRAALGVTEETDAVVITVSEETGDVSVIMGGNMTRELDASQLRRVLTRIFLKDPRQAVLPTGRSRGFFPIRSKD